MAEVLERVNPMSGFEHPPWLKAMGESSLRTSPQTHELESLFMSTGTIKRQREQFSTAFGSAGMFSSVELHKLFSTRRSAVAISLSGNAY
jgi:hypothetical protein